MNETSPSQGYAEGFQNWKAQQTLDADGSVMLGESPSPEVDVSSLSANQQEMLRHSELVGRYTAQSEKDPMADMIGDNRRMTMGYTLEDQKGQTVGYEVRNRVRPTADGKGLEEIHMQPGDVINRGGDISIDSNPAIQRVTTVRSPAEVR